MSHVTPTYLRKLEEVLAAHDPDFLELRRLHNGIVSLRMVSQLFDERDDALGTLRAELAKHDMNLPEGLLTSLYAPGELSDDELTVFKKKRTGTPTWADAMLRDPREQPCDERPELEGLTVAAFWGVKGGVGRTTALAHVAANLGRRGKNVLAVDLDLDSPALIAKLCTPEEAERARFDDLLQAYHQEKGDRQSALDANLVVNQDVADFRLHMIGQGFADTRFVTALTGPLTPAALYRGRPYLREIIADAARRAGADIVLIDARSGFCEESAASLLDLADIVFLFVSPSPSNFKSMLPAIEGIERSRLNLGHPQALYFVASLLPAGQDARNAIKTELEETVTNAYEAIKERCELTVEQLPAESELIEIHYTPQIVENEGKLYEIDGYKEIAERISVPVTLTESDIESGWVQTILDEVEIPIPQAEDASIEELTQLFTPTMEIRDFSRSAISLVLGAKGTGKTFLKRLCLESPESLRDYADFKKARFVDGFRLLRERPADVIRGNILLQELKANSESWAHIFSVMTLAAVYKTMAWDPPEAMIDLVEASSSSTMLKTIRELIEDRLGLHDQWREINQRLESEQQTICLIFDDLDVALGESPEWVSKRKPFISGLFECMNGNWLNLGQIHPKIFLREDIFRSLELEEEAKYKSRRVTLMWREHELWHLMVRAFSVGSKHFSQLLAKLNLKVETMSETDLARALGLIWGERMGRGGGDTRTRVWAARRLSDGKNRYFPRAALWLLEDAVNHQKRRGVTSQQNTLLQAVSLRASMATVSKERMAELLKEATEEERAMLELLKGEKAYQNRTELLKSMRRKISGTFDAETALENLIELGILEEGSRRDKTPTIRIVDLYAFNPDWDIKRLGRR